MNNIEFFVFLKDHPVAALFISGLFTVVAVLIHRLLKKDMRTLEIKLSEQLNKVFIHLEHIKELLSNHITDTNKEIIDLKKEMKEGQADLREEIRIGQADLRVEMRAGQAKLEKDMKEGQIRLEDEIKGVQADLKDEIKGVQANLKDEMKEGQADLKDEIKGVQAKSDKRFEKLEAGQVSLDKKLDKILANP